MIATLIDGHDTLSDWLLLIAAIVFVVGGLARMTSASDGRIALPGWLLEIGLALVAVGLLVL